MVTILLSVSSFAKDSDSENLKMCDFSKKEYKSIDIAVMAENVRLEDIVDAFKFDGAKISYCLDQTGYSHVVMEFDDIIFSHAYRRDFKYNNQR